MQPEVIKRASQALFQIIKGAFAREFDGAQFYVSEGHGDLTTKAAFLLSASLNLPRAQVSQILRERLEEVSFIKSVDCSESGYINVTLYPEVWHRELFQWLERDMGLVLEDLGKGSTVNLEYVSVNPTGPLHVGHARVAVYGDVLANLLCRFGYCVTREFYINDRGSQISDLSESLGIRYKNIALKENTPIPKGLYPGGYLASVAQSLYKAYGEDLPTGAFIRNFAVHSMMELIKEDLKLLKISHDVFTSEEELHKRNLPKRVLEKLEARGLVYRGTPPPPKGHTVDEDYLPGEQLLFKSTNFGDVQDRSLQKPDGSWTYFGSELAYVTDKVERGFSSIIMILGADHVGYLQRLKAAVEALGEGKVEFEAHVCQLVRYINGKVPVSMSKRSGEFTSLKSLVDEVGVDAIRFMMLGRKSDSQLDFDLVKVKEQSRENPVFYVQYAHARAKSVLRKAEAEMPGVSKECGIANLHRLTQPEELGLIRKMAFCLPILADAAKSRAPHKLTFFLQEISMQFHSLWDLKKVGVPYKFIAKDDPELTSARLSLVMGFAKSARLFLEILGVEPLESM